MFDALKKKFNTTIGKISDKVSEEAEKESQTSESPSSKESSVAVETESTIDEKVDELSSTSIISKNETEEKVEESFIDEEKEQKSFFSKLRRKSSDESNVKEDTSKESESDEESSTEDKSKESGIFSFIREKTISDKDIEEILWELEMSLLESDVALEVSENIINSVKEDLVGKKIKRSNDVADYTRQALKKAVSNILNVETKNIDELIKEKKAKNEPLIIMFVGINGTGKTTTIAKVSTYFIKKGYTPVIAASDTFRAGAIEQITHHAESIGVKIIKHQKGADPAAVAFDAVSHAKAKGKELVLVDTAGRMQTNINLMDEMAKIKRVAKPDMILFVGDSLTGNDAVEQAMKFNDSVGLDGIILTKADADAKGGAALSIGYVINKPILFLGTGQSYDDLIEFKPDWMLEQII